MWDAVSGGTQIQSVVLQQSGGAPTNRLTSVTTSGVTANYSYDAAGNVTNDGAHTYAYDAENRIVSVDGGATASYAYDGSNQRYKKITSGATTHYVWQEAQVIAEHNGSTGASLGDYVYSGSQMIAKASGPTIQYFVSDRLSVRMTVDSSGSVLGRQAHLPFGEDFAESGTQEKRHFTGYERDSESGSDSAVNRQYSQALGRFIRVDPIFGPNMDPQRLNRYAYVKNDPINAIDPLGLYLMSICFWNIVELDGPNYLGIEFEGCITFDVPNRPEPGSGDSSGKQPCQNVDGFNKKIKGDRKYKRAELDDAAITVFGEMSSHFNANSRAEAEAIASIIFNRSEAIARGRAPGNMWGQTSSLSDVVRAPNQFAGFRAGQDILQTGVDLNEGKRNCNRLQTAGSAIAWLAANPSARKPYLYMCASGHVTTPHCGDVEINKNVFSTEPLGCT